MLNSVTGKIALATELCTPLLYKLQPAFRIRRNNKSIESEQILGINAAVRIMAGKTGCTGQTDRLALDMESMIFKTLVGKDTGATVATITEGIGIRTLGNLVRCIKIILKNESVAGTVHPFRAISVIIAVAV